MPSSANARRNSRAWSSGWSTSRSRWPRSGRRSSARCARISLHVEEALEVVALQLGAERVAEAPANLLEDAARPLHVYLVGHLHRIAEVRPGGGARPTERVAIGVLAALPAFAGATVIALHGLLHLLHHVLGAPPHRLKCATLLADSRLAIGIAQRLLGLPHRLARIAEALTGLETHAAQRLHEGLQLLLQLPLALLELPHGFGEFLRRHRLALLALLAALTLLTLLTLLARFLSATLLLAAPLLVELKGLVHQFLLAPQHLAQLIHLLAHLALLLALAVLLLSLAHLQVVHHVLELRQKLLGLIPGARLGEILDLVEHPVEIARAQLLHVLRHLHRRIRVLHLALGELAQELLHGLAQLLHQPLDLFVAGAVLERVAQRLLRLAQPLLRRREVAFLDAESDLPQIVDDLAQLVVGPCHRQPGARRDDAQIVARIVEGFVRAQGGGIHQRQHATLLVGVERQDAALLDDGTGERVGKRPLRQHEFLRRGAAFLSGGILDRKRHRHLTARPWMLG